MNSQIVSNPYLASLSENASRLGQRIQETISEHTRDLAIGKGSAAYLESNSTVGEEKIKKQLDGTSEREKLDAMKRLVALISKGRNVSEYFPGVVKNVASSNLETRKLVYIYLLKYAEQEPDLALLSINTFQKDLSDSNPLMRAMSLRVLSGIRVPMIGNIVSLGIKKCAADPSPYVRKTAALAIPKLYDLDSNHLPALIEILVMLLKDRSPLSLGATLFAFEAICPTRLDLLHPHFRRICKLIADADEWGQVQILGTLLRYARVMFARPAGREWEGSNQHEDDEEANRTMDKDLRLLLDSTEPLLMSRNPAVVLAATKVFFYAAALAEWVKFVHPLLRLLSTSREVERCVLVDILLISHKEPALFYPHFTRFLVRSDDNPHVKRDKIALLANLMNLENWAAIVREFVDYANDVEDDVVSDAITALGDCAVRIPEALPQCLNALIQMIKSPYDIIVSHAVVVLKQLVQRQLSAPSSQLFASTSQSPLSIIEQLARKFDDIKHEQARACVIWLVGQYASSTEPSSGPQGLVQWAPDVLRLSAKSFANAASLVKLQTITLAAKLFVLSPEDLRIGQLASYVFTLARYDLNYDVRDRGRMLSSLLSGMGLQVNGGTIEDRGGVVLRREQARMVLFEGKLATLDTQSKPDNSRALLGSTSAITGNSARMDDILPDWLGRGIPSSTRDSEYDAPVPIPITNISSSSKPVGTPIVLTPTGQRPESAAGKAPYKDLDAFYAEEEPASDGTEESEEEEEEDAKNTGAENEESDETDEEESGDSEEEEEGVPLMFVNPSPRSVNTVYFDAPTSFPSQNTMSSEPTNPAANTVRSSQLQSDIPTVVSPVVLGIGPEVIQEIESRRAIQTGDVAAPIPQEAKPVTVPRKAPPPVDNDPSVDGSPAPPATQSQTQDMAETTPASHTLASTTSGRIPQTAAERLQPPPPTVVAVGVTERVVSPVSRSASRRSAFTNAEGRRLSGGAFIGGAGLTGPGTIAETDDAAAERHMQAHANLTPRQLSKIMKTEEQQNRRLSKIIKNEGKTERQALDLAIDELAELQRMQKNAVKAEAKVKANHSKLLTQLKKLEDAFLAAKLKYEAFLGQVNAEEANLEPFRTSAREITDRMQDKAAEVDTLRTTFAIDEREREVKLAQLKGKATSPTGPLSARTSTSQN